MNKKQAAAWKKAARRRFKNSYRRTLAVMREEFEAKLAVERQKTENYMKTRAIEQRQHEDRVQADAARLANEIARIRMEFGPQKYGTRFQMYVTMDETFMMNAQDLRTFAPYIVDKLSALIKREFSTIDFARVQPIVPKLPPLGAYYPRFAIDTRDGLSR